MAITERRLLSARRRAGVLAVAALFAGGPLPAAAADWTIEPRVGLRATWTDNATLSSAARARSDWITELAPSLSARASGRGLRFDGELSWRRIDYHRDSRDGRSVRSLHADLDAEPVRGLLFLDAAASIARHDVSLFAPLTVDDALDTGNREELRTLRVSPMLRHEFGSSARAQLRYDWQSRRGGSGIRDGETQRIGASLGSGEGLRRFAWGLHWNDQRVDYRNGFRIDFRQAAASAQFALTPRLAVRLTGGREDNDYPLPFGDSSGSIWSAGVVWRPTDRTRLDADAGRRYFGDTYRVAASHRTARSHWTLGYDEDLATGAGLAPDDSFHGDLPAGTPAPLPVLGGDALLSRRVTLQKRLLASVTLEGARNTLRFTAQRVRREPLGAALPGTIDPRALLDEHSVRNAVSALWTRRLSSRSDIHVRADAARIRSLDDGRADRHAALRAGLSVKLRDTLSGTLEARHQRRQSNRAGAGYDENALTLAIAMQF